MDDQTRKFYEENEGNPEAIAEAYGVDLVDPDETVESAKAVGQFALESLPGVGTAFTVADIEDELKKEEPNYVKIGMLVGTEAIGLIPGLGTAAKNMIRKGADMARQTDEVMDVASNIPKVSRKVDREADALEAARLRNDPDALEQWRKDNKLPESQRQKNIPEAEAAAQALIEGKITSKESRKRIQEAFPEPREYTAEEVMNLLPTLTEVQGALGKKGTRYPILGVEGADLAEGQIVSSRLDIPAYDDYDKWVVSIHDGNQKTGSVVGYGQAIRLKNIRFGSDADTALDIARGIRTSKATGQDAIDKKTGEAAKQNKATIARIFGEYTSEDPYDLQRQAAEIIASGSDEWVQVGMNPYRKSAFYNKKTGMPVFEADEIIQVGPLVLARNVKQPSISQIKEMAVRTKDGKIRLFNEGGVAMNKQMEMAFMQEGGVPDNTVGVDPVSGNDIPVGSTAEEVRDDIPAMLSEGEYVVPADVVKYHGLALFEALRNQAKFGLREMAEDGRIGGEPIEEGMEEELTAEDQQLLQEIMSMEDEDVVKAAYGTFIPGNTSTTVPSTQVQMPTSGQTPASTQQVQPATTQQDPSGVYGIVTGSGQPVTSSTPLVNQQPVVQGVVGTAPVTGDSTTTPGTTQTGMVTKKYVAPDCRRIDVLTLNGKIISSTPADFDVFVEATEANLKRFNCVTSDEDKTDDTTDTTTTLTGGGDDGGNDPDIKTTSDPKFDTTTDKGSRDAADYFKEKSGVSVVDPFKAAQDALNNALNADTMKGAGALAGLILGPVGTIGAGVINAGSQIDALSTAYANKSMADYLGKTDVSNSIQKAIDEFLGKAPGIVKFANKSSDLGKKKMEYALLSAQSVNAPDDMALTEDRFGSSEAFNSAMNEVATAGMVYNAEEKVYERTTETVEVPTTGGGSVTVGAGTQASTASAATVDRDTGRVVFTPGEKTVRPVLRPGSGGDDSSSAPVGVVGNNDTGSNNLAQSIANFFTPNDGKEYVDGKLVSTSSNDDNNDSPSSSESSGCCFIMLEARYGNGTMDEVVRRYRDEYMTDRNRRGYYKTAEVLVPLMRKSKVFKWVVTKTFADPLVSYGKYYYGENKHGVIFTPVKNFWMKLFDVVGGDTEFIRENGEVV